MENPTHTFRETNLVLQLKLESQITSKTVIVGARDRKKRAFSSVYFARRNFF